MKKKSILLSITLFFLTIFSSVVYAKEESSLLKMFGELGVFLFHDLPTLGDYGIKFLLWIALFALANFGLRKAFDNKTASIVAFVISLLSVIFIPHKAIVGIFETYTFIVVFALGVFVPLLLLWVVHNSFEGDRPIGRVLRGATYIAIGVALYYFTQYAELSMTAGGLR